MEHCSTGRYLPGAYRTRHGTKTPGSNSGHKSHGFCRIYALDIAKTECGHKSWAARQIYALRNPQKWHKTFGKPAFYAIFSSFGNSGRAEKAACDKSGGIGRFYRRAAGAAAGLLLEGGINQTGRGRFMPFPMKMPAINSGKRAGFIAGLTAERQPSGDRSPDGDKINQKPLIYRKILRKRRHKMAASG